MQTKAGEKTEKRKEERSDSAQLISSLPKKLQKPAEKEGPYSSGGRTAAGAMRFGPCPKGFLDSGSATTPNGGWAASVSADRGEHHAWRRRKWAGGCTPYGRLHHLRPNRKRCLRTRKAYRGAVIHADPHTNGQVGCIPH